MSLKTVNLQQAKPLAAVSGLSIAMIVLIGIVQTVAPRQRPPEPVLSELDPIAIFPDFGAITDVSAKKQQFFDYLEDYVDHENQRMLGLREELYPLADMARSGVPFSDRERNWIFELAITYDLNPAELSQKALLAELMLRVDVIPASLVLAQAANESAWGTSRFALEGNNLFGQWCFEEGCGLVPRRRASGATHEVKSFDSIAGAVQAYFNNINTNQSYEYLRELRADMREEEQQIDSMVLAFGLGRYSERGDHYVDEVQNIILQNELHARDRDFSG
ncbi:MAG: glucosaminidase domain-containing protein [Pseudohongiellaceae bacterium]